MADNAQAPDGLTSQGEGNSPETVTNDQLNKAITARFKEFEKSIDKKLKGAFESTIGDFSTKMDEVFSAKIAEALGGKASEAKPTKVEEDPRYKGLEKQLAELNKRYEQAEAARAAEAQRSRDTMLRQKLAEELGSMGIGGIGQRHALGFLVDSEKRVRWSEDGETIVFQDGDSEVDLATGLRSWAKSDEAKLYLPPRGAVGSGDRPQTGGRAPQNGKYDRESAANALASWLGLNR